MDRSPGTLENSIDVSAKTITDPAGKNAPVIFETDALRISGIHQCTLKDVYAAAMGKNIWPVRYIRNRGSIRINEQIKLARSRVAVIGAGGLGGYVIEILARIGIGRLTVVDGGCFDESNLNRQLLADTAAIGKKKAFIAAERVGRINPAVDVYPHTVYLDGDNAEGFLDGCNLVVDALDNMETRRVLKKTCRTLNIPLVHGAICGFEGRIMGIFPDDPDIQALFDNGEGPAAEALMGTPAVAPAVIASLQAMEAVKILLQRGRSFRKTMLYADLENGIFNDFTF
ncbi:MAG: HesA/MoeB/ThiF family protein [Desulfosalsimonadaceae bacterium]